MSDQSGLIEEGLAAARDALCEFIGRNNLHLWPCAISAALARKARRLIRTLETMLRRLLVLMAAELTLEPARKSPPREGVRTARKAPRGFALMLPPGGCLSSLQAEALAGLKLARNYPATGLLLHRLGRLQSLLANPAPAARRMARLLARLKASGAPRPAAYAQTGLYRHGARLALIAGILPQAIQLALADWYDTS